MSLNHSTTSRRSFKHLSFKFRAQIEILLKQGVPKIQIARILGISRSTLYRELARGSVDQLDHNLKPFRVYFADAGQRAYESNRSRCHPPLKLAKAADFIAYVEDGILNNHRSPDALCGMAVLHHSFPCTVSTKTIYNYIDAGLLKVKNIDLLLKVRRKRKSSRNHEHKRLYGQSIEQRPKEISDRSVFGHWEIDTIVGTINTAPVLLCLDERKTRTRLMVKIPSRSTQGVHEGIAKLRQRFGNGFDDMFLSVTADNGSEFSRLSQEFPRTQVYYAHPYSSYERGTNENQNGIVRRFFPKGSSFVHVSDEAIAAVENWINTMPRRMFHYSCSINLFSKFTTVPFVIAI